MSAFHLSKRAAPRIRGLLHAPRAVSHVLASNALQRRLSSTQPLYPGHVPLNWFEHAFMLAGASYMALTAPARHGTCELSVCGAHC